jgi:25S rRNA (uracil2634-N3)-methyltransferase
MYPGYTHRRTIGFEEGFSAADNQEIKKQGAKTYVFGWNRKADIFQDED